MDNKKSYKGIDYFRFIAALLIIAIHTSPLLSYSKTAGLLLERIIARLGVPFFFMASGFFLISRYARDNKRLWNFIKKTNLIYGAAILAYIPLNIYNGYFGSENLLPNIIKDIVFDGTFYHLWYLPASILGAFTAWHLVRKQGFSRALIMTSSLYVIGLLGDSYYGITENIKTLNAVYRSMFLLFDYTRNGIFFAPLFFVLGGYIRDKNDKADFGKKPENQKFSKKCMLLNILFLFLMTIEALILHSYNLCRHDSMYIFLPFCMYYLFNLIILVKGGRSVFVRNMSLLVYIVHPAVIALIRPFARVLGLWEVLIENGIVNYSAVCILSVIISAFILWYRKKFEKYAELRHGQGGLIRITAFFGFGQKKLPESEMKTCRSWIEINLKNLEHNVSVLKNAMPPESEIMAVVKANAYGHGDFEISSHLNKMGVNAFACATLDEGITLRKSGIQGEILILGYTAPCLSWKIRKYDLTQTIIDISHGRDLNSQAVEIKCHIKIDTGMHRLGIPCENIEEIAEAFSKKYLKITGIYTHLCCSDNPHPEYAEYTRRQISEFYRVINSLKDNGIKIPKTHIQSSYGLLNYPDLKCDYVRLGISLYGVLSSPDSDTKVKLMLKPVLSLKSRVVLIRSIKAGDRLGYNRDYTVEKDSLIAILPIGYGDGFPRNLSCEKSRVIIRGQYAPVVGRICMDQLAVDITGLDNIHTGDIATLIGEETYPPIPQKMQINAEDAAQNSKSITNELLCRMGERLPIVAYMPDNE